MLEPDATLNTEVKAAQRAAFYALWHTLTAYAFTPADANRFKGLTKQLRALLPIFPFERPPFGSDYVRASAVLELAWALKQGAITLSSHPVHFQLSFTSLIGGCLHHDPHISPLILSQIPWGEPVEWERPYRGRVADLAWRGTLVEVGDCHVEKPLEALAEGYYLWVIPKPFHTVYTFSRGLDWKLVTAWEEYKHGRFQEKLERAYQVIHQAPPTTGLKPS